MALREFSSVKVGDELPERVITLTRADLVNYAGVSGDLQPDPLGRRDRQAGRPRHRYRARHAHHGTRWRLRHRVDWRPGAVTEYNVRFTSIVPVPNDGVGSRSCSTAGSNPSIQTKRRSLSR